MPHLIGPDFIAIQVKDIEAARHFYTEVVGLTVNPHSPPDAVVFNTKPIPFAARAPLVDLDVVDSLGHGVALWFACDDADALHKHLVDQDVAILSAPNDGPFGRFFVFRDPFGYQITAHTA